MTLRFGTDGVRGAADDLTDAHVEALGRAAARLLAADLRSSAERFLIGRDTRASGPRIEAALARGLATEGVAAELVGVAPTPAVAWIAAARNVPAAMISASHNPYHDNGIKLFAPGGRKLPDAVEGELGLLATSLVGAEVDEATVAWVGPPRAEAGDLARYQLALAGSIGGRELDGLHVVVDCANGAASAVAPDVLRRLGARVEVLHAEPDGRNINAGCGSTHPEDLAAAVVASGAHVGLAFDGDADRVVAVDEAGAVVDGDQLIALCAIDLRQRGRLAGDTVVVTVMTNLGFRSAMADRGIEVVETSVGDRYVLEALDAGGWSLGGEQSGHVIFRDLATTGDGILTGVQLLDLVARSGRPLSALASEAMVRLPQVLRNVALVPRSTGAPMAAAVVAAIADDIAEVEAELGERGRVLVRPSGTEPLVRVMVEATAHDDAERAAARLVAAVERAGPA